MAYFLIIPVYILLSVILLTAAILSPQIEFLKIYQPYRWSLLIWSSIGFWIINLLGFGLPIAILFLTGIKFDGSQSTAKNIFQILFGFWLILGPFVLSALGFALGTFWGWWSTRRKIKTVD